MKLHIYQEKDTPIEVEKDVYLDFEKKPSGRIVVKAVDKSGRMISHLVVFDLSGTVARIGCIAEDLGFQLDSRGRIKERE